jgi:3-oxoacyl-[acyl-carrier protein] reductase
MADTPSKELAGKVALVTGAAKNIGRSIALSLAAGGAAVAINTLSSREEAEAVAKEIRDAGGKANVYLADISEAAAVVAMGEAVVRDFGRIDILVLNASMRKETRFVDMDFEQWRRSMNITLDGSFHCVKASLPSMIAAGGGSIITLGGDNALYGAVGKVNSSAAKNGLLGMTRALAKELAQHNIRVNCVSPGAIETVRPAYRAPRKPPDTGRIPLGRFGKPEEIAAVVRFLCGPGASYITGQTVHVSGGMVM